MTRTTRGEKSISKTTSNLPSTFVYKAGDVGYTIPSLFEGGNSKTHSLIKKACDEVVGDYSGCIFINSLYLDKLLRTKSFVAKEILSNIHREEKLMCSNLTYIKLGEIMKLITKRLEVLKVGKTRSYLLLVEEFLLNIRDSDKFLNIRSEMQEELKLELNKLKYKRKRKYKIINDELTRDELVRGAQISHIRAKSVYPSLALSIDNGLLVNLETHETITSRQITNEDELLDLCKELGWRTNWYSIFKNLSL